LIFKAKDGGVHVVTVPVKDENVVLSPNRNDYQNLDIILANIGKLRCDMYDSSLIPIALVNKLVSLANRPSALILEKFAKASLDK
ncbi:MAG: NurA domain-containing protein, partial [Pseudomonadota bacterium]